MAHVKVYKKYMDKLIKALPMNDIRFTTQLAGNGILPPGVASHIEALSTSPDKADHFLNNAIKTSLDIDETAEFNKLITVMEKCGYSHVERMANKMKSDLDKELKGTYVRTYVTAVCMYVCMYVAYEIFNLTLQIKGNSQLIRILLALES